MPYRSGLYHVESVEVMLNNPRHLYQVRVQWGNGDSHNYVWGAGNNLTDAVANAMKSITPFSLARADGLGKLTDLVDSLASLKIPDRFSNVQPVKGKGGRTKVLWTRR